MGTIEKFTEWREKQNYSYGRMSVKIGINKGYLYQIETFQRKCPDSILFKMAKMMEEYY